MKANLFLVFFVTGLFLISEDTFSSGRNETGNSSGIQLSSSSIPLNKRLLPAVYNQVQTSVATSPVNSNVMSAAAITDLYPGGYTTGAFFTTNAGINWTGTNAIKMQNGGIISTVGDPNIVIDKNGTHIISFTAPPLSGSDFKAGICYSTNNGAYWSSTVYIPGVGRADKIMSSADNFSASPFYGNVYVIYSDFIKMGLYISKSTDGGMTWDTVKRLSPSNQDARVGASVIIGKNGEIFVSWPYFDPIDLNSYVGFAKSTDGGSTWSADDNAFQVNTLRIAHKVFVNNVRANGLPTMNMDRSGGPGDGTLYITCTEKAAAGSPASDDYDILIHSSTDQGNSWNPPVKVNQDINSSMRYQFYPAITIDSKGGIDIVYYDSRNTPTNDSFQVYLSRSIDGGNNFEDKLISDHKFFLKPIDPSLFGVPGYIGTYIGITSSGETITPVWFDNSLGKYQAWSSQINIGAEITYIPEGMYDLAANKLICKDSVKVYLRNSSSPFNKIDSSSATLDSINFMAKSDFKNAVSGNYYVEVSHRNSMSVWSSSPVNYSTCEKMSYDFTSACNQAFGGLLTSVNDKWCAFAGDVNADLVIDMYDVNLVFNDISLFTSGYTNSDLNGDNVLDLVDLNIAINNSNKFIQFVTP
ncbi:MAG TPA: hypothetical protein PKA90_03040 [Ignavibacteria bacterium]|nr:hypothetical protein [Ignavibacteria bacterium]HMR39385.1 hypothetical protein [Ignavibacteria bacterium]